MLPIERPRILDVAIGAGLLSAGVAEAVTLDTGRPPWVHLLVCSSAAVAIAYRRVLPLVALGVSLAAIVFSGGPDTPFGLFAGMVIATYTVGQVLSGWRAWVGLAIGVGLPFVGVLLDDPQPADLVAIPVLYGGAWGAGRLVHEQTRRADRAAARASELEEADEVRRAEAAAEERARIARELHDVISHSISVITVQTQAVRRRLGPDHAREAEDLLAVETTARQAMAELRRLFGVLRSEGEKAPLAPQPGLGQLPRLVERVSASGVPVELVVDGEVVDLGPGIDLTAYRIVQEALTNTLKHAQGATATVHLRYGREDLEIRVVDDGTATSSNGVGHGLVGMQERVNVYGGRLTCGPLADGGFEVIASLPLGEGVTS